MGVEAELGIPLAIAVAAGAVLLPPYFFAYKRWVANAITHPDVDFHKSFLDYEREAKGNIRFLIGQATKQLDIATYRLDVSVWNNTVTDYLLKALDQNPDLTVRVLTGPQITGSKVGVDDSAHPFYFACRDNPNRVTLRTLERYFLPEGVRADDQLLQVVMPTFKELIPSRTFYRDYDGDSSESRGAVYDFSVAFERLWDQADRDSLPRMLLQATP